MQKIYDMCEKLEEYANTELAKTKEEVCTQELSEVVDMIKDLAEVKKLAAEAHYYDTVIEAMENSEYGEDYDWEGRLGYPVRRNQQGTSGRSMYNNGRSRRGYEEYEPDYPMMEREMEPNTGRMYTSMSARRMDGSRSGGSTQVNPQGRPSRYGFSHDKYMKERKMYNSNTPEDKEKRAELLDDYMEDLYDSAKEMVTGMTPEEKQMWKTKINKIVNM